MKMTVNIWDGNVEVGFWFCYRHLNYNSIGNVCHDEMRNQLFSKTRIDEYKYGFRYQKDNVILHTVDDQWINMKRYIW